MSTRSRLTTRRNKPTTLRVSEIPPRQIKLPYGFTESLAASNMKRNQWTAALIAVLLFCCGAAFGVLAHRYYTSTSVSAKSAENFRHHYISEMRSKLNLSESQVTQLEA